MKKYLLLISFLLAIFVTKSTVYAEAKVDNKSDLCPQSRKTIIAPKAYLEKENPLRREPRHIKKGRFYLTSRQNLLLANNAMEWGETEKVQWLLI